MRPLLFGLMLCGLALSQSQADLAPPPPTYDVVVYGGTAGGVVAAVHAARLKKSVILIEPGKHLGGLTSGGLGATDIGNKRAIGGVSREFYQRIKKYYQDDKAWRQEKRADYRGNRNTDNLEEDAMWTFEPHVAELVLREMITEAKVPVVYGSRLKQKGGVRKEGASIHWLVLDNEQTILGRRFIDATYEGDLMAAAGVKYHIGREAEKTYGESLNGVRVKHSLHHQFTKPVDPYVKPGDKSSGLLPGIDPKGPGEEGAGDARVQAYNLRICATNDAANRIPWPKPENYDEREYELLLRNFEAGDDRIGWNPVRMPNRKTDSNNNFAVSTDWIGRNYDYPDGDYATRDRIYLEHLRYHQGLFWTLANHERVPEKIRKHFGSWGLCKDEFTDNGGWPHQMYVREARRMISGYVMSQADCQRHRTAEDSVGLGAYNMDSHNVQRYVDDKGHVRNEGDIQVGVSPYPISYRSIVPKEEECDNLFVPICLSASHISYGSIRMEPVFMVLGQSSATAAVLSLDEKIAVQKIDYSKLKEKLLAEGQVLEWARATSETPKGLDISKISGIVIDDGDAKRTGEWTKSSTIGPYVGDGYLHDGNEGKGEKSLRFPVQVKVGGRYEVFLGYTPNANRASNVKVRIEHARGKAEITVDQKKHPDDTTPWRSLGTFEFGADETWGIIVDNAGSDGYVVVDAVRLVPQK